MANTKYLNQLELTGTFTPSNTAIIANDDGQTVAQKTQGQINAITPPSLPLSLANGGTNANLVANNGGIFYSAASAGAILNGTATANQVLLSGASTTPAWSTATYPATTTINRILYSSNNNVIGQITTANSAVLITDAGGVPSLGTTLPAVAAGSCTCTNPTTASSSSINTALSDVYSVIPLITNAFAYISAPVSLAVNTTGWQVVTGAAVTLNAGTYLISYSCSLYAQETAYLPQGYYTHTTIFNSLTSASIAGAEQIAFYFLGTYFPNCAGSASSGVILTLASTATIQVKAYINNTTNLQFFSAQNASITAIKI